MASRSALWQIDRDGACSWAGFRMLLRLLFSNSGHPSAYIPLCCLIMKWICLQPLSVKLLREIAQVVHMGKVPSCDSFDLNMLTCKPYKLYIPRSEGNYSGTPLNGHPWRVDTYDIMDTCKCPDRISIDIRNPSIVNTPLFHITDTQSCPHCTLAILNDLA